ncbi:hypothetical protein O1611_g8853 [Lasiodiplodia mahajangana]|uniref:Uncharacterized protein n=1 Tax=Lasiodiplodia mahajangana TaxID=1108764 RepID=A0ACC2JBM2_9PEZI|nr:hypothetical protein O1611_g8853 [Lasiodiplodia mahajangana]
MLRLGIYNTPFRHSRLGSRSPVSTIHLEFYTTSPYHIASPDETGTQPRDRKVTPLRNMHSEQTHRSSSTSSFDKKPDRRWVFVGKEWSQILPIGPWAPAPDPINFQDVRGHGPLFAPKPELDADPEKAKDQWRELCQAYKRKQGIAIALWEKSRELEARDKANEVMLEKKEDELAAVHAQLYEQMGNNKMLYDELKRMRSVHSTLHKDEK